MTKRHQKNLQQSVASSFQQQNHILVNKIKIWTQVRTEAVAIVAFAFFSNLLNCISGIILQISWQGHEYDTGSCVLTIESNNCLKWVVLLKKYFF